MGVRRVGTGKQSALGGPRPNVCFGSKADILGGLRDVRFTPKSGHGSAENAHARPDGSLWHLMEKCASRHGDGDPAHGGRELQADLHATQFQNHASGVLQHDTTGAAH